jgi:hypothetical protein
MKKKEERKKNRKKERKRIRTLHSLIQCNNVFIAFLTTYSKPWLESCAAITDWFL